MADLTAAKHFLKGEALLAEAEKYPGATESNAVRAARAQAHFTAAQFLLAAEPHRYDSTDATGVSKLLDDRSTY